MKIIKLQAENIKKLKAVEITPKGNLVKISGKNAQGKTSVLDSILYALAGKKYIPSKPIREGEEKASIELDLGDLKVLRTFTQGGTYLKVVTKEGAEYPKAQDKLSNFVKNISFDPLEFANKSSKEQVEILTELLGIGEKLNDLDSKYSELYDERRMANRQLKEAEAQANIEKPEDKYFSMDKIDVSKVSDDLEAEREKFRIIQSCNNDIQEVDQEIKRLTEELKHATKERERLSLLKHKTEKDYDENRGKELKAKLESATEINSLIDSAKDYQERQDVVAKYSKESEKLEKVINSNRKERSELVAKSKMPIKGLDITEDGMVTYNGIPFDQLSGAERLKVSLSIAMAMNPELRVIRILDGSLLDEDNLKVIEDMAKDQDYQVWIEIVDSTGEVGFYIEEGEVKKAN